MICYFTSFLSSIIGSSFTREVHGNTPENSYSKHFKLPFSDSYWQSHPIFSVVLLSLVFLLWFSEPENFLGGILEVYSSGNRTHHPFLVSGTVLSFQHFRVEWCEPGGRSAGLAVAWSHIPPCNLHALGRKLFLEMSYHFHYQLTVCFKRTNLYFPVL